MLVMMEWFVTIRINDVDEREERERTLKTWKGKSHGALFSLGAGLRLSRRKKEEEIEGRGGGCVTCQARDLLSEREGEEDGGLGRKCWPSPT